MLPRYAAMQPEPPWSTSILSGERSEHTTSALKFPIAVSAIRTFTRHARIESDVEVIPIKQANEAYARALRGDLRFRFVIDLNSLA
jgi:alcohol dehydrogenase (NADP+)